MFGYALCVAVGVFAGWVIFPAPKMVMDWWAKHGWTKP